MVNDFLREENIYNDAEKLAAYQRFIDPHSSDYSIIQASTGLTHAQTRHAFCTGLLNVLSPFTTESSFQYWSQIRSIQWNKKSVIQVYCSQVQKVLDDFETSTETYFGVKFDPIMKRTLIFATIYDCTPKEHCHKIIEYFTIYLEYPDQIKEYMSKTANILENPFKSANASSRKFTEENCF